MSSKEGREKGVGRRARASPKYWVRYFRPTKKPLKNLTMPQSGSTLYTKIPTLWSGKYGNGWEGKQAGHGDIHHAPIRKYIYIYYATVG